MPPVGCLSSCLGSAVSAVLRIDSTLFRRVDPLEVFTQRSSVRTGDQLRNTRKGSRTERSRSCSVLRTWGTCSGYDLGATSLSLVNQSLYPRVDVG